MLQKRLADKLEEAGAKSTLLCRKQTLYAQLEAIIARRPGPEAAEKVSARKTSLREHERIMDQMDAELRSRQSQVGEGKLELVRLADELKDAKKEFYEQKKRQEAQEAKRLLERAAGGESGSHEARPATATRTLHGREFQVLSSHSPTYPPSHVSHRILPFKIFRRHLLFLFTRPRHSNASLAAASI